MPGHSTGAPQAPRHHRTQHHTSRPAAQTYRQSRTVSRESSQDSNKDPHGEHVHVHHTGHSQYSDNKHSRSRSHPRNGTGRGSEAIGFIPGSADSTPNNRQTCGSCASAGWSSCKALICCVLTCGFYGSREPCLPVNESSTDHPPKGAGEPLSPNGVAITNPTCDIPVETNKLNKFPKLDDSFRYPDVRIGGQTVTYPPAAPKRNRTPGKEASRPVSNTSLISREDYDLDDLSDTGTDIDSLITKKLLELYALHQIDQLAKCTSDSSFSRKTNEISDLIYNIAHDYNLQEQEAECKLVHGVIRISTRKGKRREKSHPSVGQRPNGRSNGLPPDSGNETMSNTFISSDSSVPEVKVSERTPSDDMARKMRHYSERTYSSSTNTTYSPYHHNTDSHNSSGVPLLL